MLNNLTGWHALVILAIVLLVFGSSKLPALAKSVGQSVKILKDEVHESQAPTAVGTANAAEPTAAASAPATDPAAATGHPTS
ncbi:MAG TPA: twin-arginine translocase TatA/TatE family subunit [Aeromicrobium sp.]|nr:twin-arginine translocase TatA/TatE family subunit [Aeromicrobium sp.]